jgi:hypothetical protein
MKIFIKKLIKSKRTYSKMGIVMGLDGTIYKKDKFVEFAGKLITIKKKRRINRFYPRHKRTISNTIK